MTNGINFYSKVDYIVEFLNNRISVCVCDVCPLATRGSRRLDVSVFIISRCQLVQDMLHAITVANRLAAVFSVILKAVIL